MNIPKSCGRCRYGNTYDLSVDDLCTYCFILGYEEEWCEFPNRRDNTIRMGRCPLPNLTEKQIKVAEDKINTHKQKKKIAYRVANGKTKLIRKRNVSRFIKLNNKINTGNIPIEWFCKGHIKRI